MAISQLYLSISPDNGVYTPLFVRKPQAHFMAVNLHFWGPHPFPARHRPFPFQNVEDLREKGVEVNFRRALLEQCQETNDQRRGVPDGFSPLKMRIKHGQTWLNMNKNGDKWRSSAISPSNKGVMVCHGEGVMVKMDDFSEIRQRCPELQ